MEPTRSQSEAQRSLGLSDDCYSKYLVSPLAPNPTLLLSPYLPICIQYITLDVAKGLVNQLSQDFPRQTRNFAWKDVSLPNQRAALLRVQNRCEAEGIVPIKDDKVRERLKKAMATYQRRT